MATTTTTSGGMAASAAQQKAERQMSEAQRHIEEGKQEAAAALEKAKDQGKQTAEEVREQAQQVAEEVKATAQEAGAQAQRQTVNTFEKQKAAAASGINTFKEAIESASQRLREDENHNVADYAESAAAQLGKTAEYLNRRGLSDLTADVERFARKRPEVFFGGLLVAGLAVSRFLKASAPRRPQKVREKSETPQWPYTGEDLNRRSTPAGSGTTASEHAVHSTSQTASHQSG